MDRVLVTVTPKIFSVLRRVMPGSGGGGGAEEANLPFFGVKIISTDLARLRVRLLALDHASMCSSSIVMVWALLAGIITYVSSADLDSRLPVVTAFKSAASTTYIAGAMAEPCIILAEISRNAETCPLYSVQCSYKKVQKPIIDIAWDIKLGYLFCEGGMSVTRCQRPWKSLGR